jgi:hypothetical protein
LIKRGNHKFYYQGQIINEDKALVRNAMAFLVVGKDTLKSLAPTGNDGNFTIELDTIEGIKGYLHYGHPDYLSNCLFRTISPSTNEQFVLEKKVKPTSNEKKPRTFNLNVIDDVLIREIALKTGLIYVAKKPDFEIKFIVDESLIEKIEDRYRYVGGMVNIMISDRSCGCAKGNISPSHILGFTREMLNDWLNQQIKNIVISTRMDLAEEIAQCLRNQL